MLTDILVQIGALVAITCSIFLSIKFLVYLRKKQTNVEFWATFFEGVTHKTQTLEPLKEPEVFEEKLSKKDGEDKNAVKARKV